MKRDEDPGLWDLLDRATEPTVSPFFTRNVLRKIRATSDWITVREWLDPRRLIPLAGLAAVLVGVTLLPLRTPVAPLAEPLSDTLATFETIDYELLADLEVLLASDDNKSIEEAVLF